MAKKPKQDDLPRCEDCACAEFEQGMQIGECHLLPMDWIPDSEGDPVPMWKPAVREGYCRHFLRKTH